MTNEVSELRVQQQTMQNEADRQSVKIASLNQEVTGLNNKLTVTLAEHRELKQSWLAEKTELTQRFHQIQVLNTQIKGTLKKAEMDFSKLQNRLEKQNNKNSKSIVISKPLPKTLSQKPNAPTIKDVEIASLEFSMKSLEEENASLKQTAAKAQDEIRAIRDQCDYQLAHLKAQRETTSWIQSTATSMTSATATVDKANLDKCEIALREALQVIQDQDRLITQSLFSKLPYYDALMKSIATHAADVMAIDTSSPVASPVKKYTPSMDCEMPSFEFQDILPPGACAT